MVMVFYCAREHRVRASRLMPQSIGGYSLLIRIAVGLLLTITLGCVRQVSDVQSPTTSALTAMLATSTPPPTTSPSPLATTPISEATATTHLSTATISPPTTMVTLLPPPLSPTPAAVNVMLSTPEGQQKTGPIVVAVLISDEQAIYLLNQAANLLLTVKIQNGRPTRIAWSANSCQLLITIESFSTNTGQIVSLDLSSGTVEQYFSYELPRSDTLLLLPMFPALSPDRQWVAYSVWSGELYYTGAEYQDVEIVASDRTLGPFRITERGGAWWKGGAWSANGGRYAYADYDELGNSQLYLANPEGTEWVQVTAFNNSIERVGPVKWSPDSNQLAFSSWTADWSDGSLWVVEVDGMNLTKLGPDEMPPVQAEQFWWSKGSSVVVAQAADGGPHDGIYWLDVRTGEVQHVIYSSDVPLSQIVGAFPTSSDLVVRFVAGDQDLYEYDAARDTLVKWWDREPLPSEGYALLNEVEAPPGGEVNLLACSDD